MPAIDQQEIFKLCASGRFKHVFSLCLEPAKQGDGEAQSILGWMYYLGLGVEQDESKGLEWVEKAAQSNNPRLLFGLARILEDLDEYSLAETIYRESAIEGYLPSEFRLAQMIRYGIGHNADKKLALTIFQSIGKKGHLPSQAAAATLLRKGEAGFGGRIIGLLQTIYVFIKFVWFGFVSPQSERLVSSFPPEFNVVMANRKREAGKGDATL